jgi:D-alanyl-D-alanine carboxypeptidase
LTEGNQGLPGDHVAQAANLKGRLASVEAGAGACRVLRSLFIAALFAIIATTGSSRPALAKYAAIVMDADTGAVLYQNNADARHYPASLTKVMTLFLVFDALKADKLTMDSKIRFSHRAARQPVSRLGIPAGGTIKVRDAIMAMIVKSANDVATAVGEHLGGTERKFSDLMNRKAQSIGMKNSSFRNASGLPNRRQLVTARDYAHMVRALQRQHPDFYKLFSTRSFTWEGRKHDNHNRLLDRYEGADGVKTGYIRASGFNLAASAIRSGRRLIGVVMGTRSPRARDLHMMGLLERGFEKATDGRYIAYDYDRNLSIQRNIRPVAASKKVVRARGARGRIRLARLTPPRRPAELARNTGEGSAFAPEIPSVPEKEVMNWKIQVGAFSRLAPAHLSATRAMRRLPSLLAHARVNIMPSRENGQTVYRARLGGLNAEGAERACELLKAKSLPCITVVPAGAERLGTKTR